jgi:hypothetical protein
MIIKEFKKYSQSSEDGVIQSILDKIGAHNNFYVEFGERTHGKGSNTAYLRENGWDGLVIGIDPSAPHIYKAKITAENINDIFKTNNVPKIFDVLSIDIDGNDYWVWKALDYDPRVVVIEFNSNIPPSTSCTITYNPDHTYKQNKHYGASLLALKKLGEEKGYSLIYTTGCLNAFFVKTELLDPHMKNIDTNDIHTYPVDIKEFYKKWGLTRMPTWYDSDDPDTNSTDWVRV